MSESSYLKNSEEFWETYRKAREERDRQLAKLSFSEKSAITEKLQIDYEILQNAKRKPEQFGLGEVSNSTTEIFIENSFSQADFEAALNMVFPTAWRLQVDQESF